jgi:arylsulfatase
MTEMKPNILLITFDALRADVIEDKKLAPNFHKLAGEGIKFKNAFTQAPFTWAAFGSIFTGKYPSEACYKNGTLREVPTLPEIFKEKGYYTAGFHSNPYLSESFGFNRGFTKFESGLIPIKFNSKSTKISRSISRFYRIFRKQPYLNGEELNRKVKSWINKTRKPFFLWMHFMDSHGPYQSKEGFDYLNKMRGEILYHKAKKNPEKITEAEKEKLFSWYQEEVSYCDKKLGELIDFLKEKDLFENTIIIVTSDHGDAFYEHGKFCHPRQLYEEQIHVPLIIKEIKKESGLINQGIVGLVDIFPTILEMSGIKFDLGDIAGLPINLYGKTRDFIISEATPDRDFNEACVRMDKWKYISRGHGKEELYNLENDPGEGDNIAFKEPKTTKKMKAYLRDYLTTEMEDSIKKLELDEDLKGRLKALGYID